MALTHSTVSCAACGTHLLGANPSDPIDQRTPCPRCGSTARSVSAFIEETLKVTESFATVHILHSERLISTARDLLSAGKFSLAVVVAHTAYEVGVERAISLAARAKGIEYLEDAIDGLLNNFNIGNSRVHKFFTALTGETVTDKPFWKGLTDSVQRRKQIVHRGLEVSQADAESSVTVAEAIVDWLKSRFA
jgi:HEPN domain-containing protein